MHRFGLRLQIQLGSFLHISFLEYWAAIKKLIINIHHHHYCSFFFLRFYLFIHERHRERERQRLRQREKQAPCREPDVGLDPTSPGSHPRLKADAKLLSHPGCPNIVFITFSKLFHIFHPVFEGSSKRGKKSLPRLLKTRLSVTTVQ